MALMVRAIYKDGLFRPLEDITLADGEEVNLSVISDRDLVRAALSDMLVKFPDPPDDDNDFDEVALLAEIADAFEGLPPLSETIIAERREGP